MSKSALFNIALSFLKKEELGTLKVGMKEFIKGSFSRFLTDVFSEMFDEDERLPKSFSIAGSRTLSVSETGSEERIRQVNEH